MKKFLMILSAIFLASPAFAAVSTDEVMSVEYLNNHGHSQEMTRLIHLQNDQINGHCTGGKKINKGIYKYLPFNIVRTIVEYIDPASDDGLFMQHSPSFENGYKDL